MSHKPSYDKWKSEQPWGQSPQSALLDMQSEEAFKAGYAARESEETSARASSDVKAKEDAHE